MINMYFLDFNTCNLTLPVTMTNLDGTSHFYYARHGPLTMLCYWQLQFFIGE